MPVRHYMVCSLVPQERCSTVQVFVDEVPYCFHHRYRCCLFSKPLQTFSNLSGKNCTSRRACQICLGCAVPNCHLSSLLISSASAHFKILKPHPTMEGSLSAGSPEKSRNQQPRFLQNLKLCTGSYQFPRGLDAHIGLEAQIGLQPHILCTHLPKLVIPN